MARLTDDPSVKSLEPNYQRTINADPVDPAYAAQWNLPDIGWNVVWETAIAGSATVAVLDTGVDASHNDLDDHLVGGYGAIDGSTPSADPNGHGTWMAGITAAETDNTYGIAGVAL